MKVNVTVQCLATLFVPTGLYAFKRIGKFKKGALTYVMTFSLWVIQTLFFIPDYNNPSSIGVYGLISFLVLAIGITVPIIFMKHWSDDWNKKIKKESPII